MRRIFIALAQLISRTFDSDLLQIPMNITPLLSRNLPSGVLFGPVESLDPTSSRMKTDKPSQSHMNVIQR